MSTGVAQSPNFQWEVQKKDTSAESLVSHLFWLLHPRITVNLTVKEKEMSILVCKSELVSLIFKRESRSEMKQRGGNTPTRGSEMWKHWVEFFLLLAVTDGRPKKK